MGWVLVDDLVLVARFRFVKALVCLTEVFFVPAGDFGFLREDFFAAVSVLVAGFRMAEVFVLLLAFVFAFFTDFRFFKGFSQTYSPYNSLNSKIL